MENEQVRRGMENLPQVQRGMGRGHVGEQLSNVSRRQGNYWIATIPEEIWTPKLDPGVQYVRGQLEQGHRCTCQRNEERECTCSNPQGYRHWQVLFILERKGSLTRLKSILGITGFHAELTRSKAAEEYVWKEDTRVDGTQFEFGQRRLRRNSEQDWEGQ